MLLLPQLENDVALRRTRLLFSFSSEDDFFSIFHSFLCLYFNISRLVDNFAAATDRADILENFPTSTALSASVLDLHLHHPHVHHLCYNAVSAALRTSFELTALSSRSATRVTVYFPLNVVLLL